MLNLPIKIQQFIGPLCIAAICIILWFFEPLSSEYLAFNRNLLVNAYWWQFITSNLVHTNTNHLLLNLAGICLLWAIHGQYYNFSLYLAKVAVLCLWVTIGLYFFSPDLIRYLGLSGVLHGLFVYGAFKDIQHKVQFGWLLMVGVWIKISYEQIYGAEQMIMDLIAANVAVDAHLYGAIGGLGCILIDQIRNKYLPQNN